MTSKQIGPFAQAWYKWKALRLPWRRRFLIGFDLQGNTFWEFRHTRGSQDTGERWRRIVAYPRSTHYSQVRVSPQWHQWLRHTRREPPSLDEQRAEAVRQERIKLLAAQADARWEAKPRVMEDPAGPGPARGLPLAAGDIKVKAAGADTQPAQLRGAESEKPRAKAKQVEEDPWARATAQGPGEKWQPTAWDPSAAKTKR
ncbi:hypothetical protein J3F83DRAFT_734213 [Trichoderma novae-zelandiae]